MTIKKNVQHTLSLKDAAEKLGITQEAARKRLQRNKIKGFKQEDGTWRVILDTVQDSPPKSPRHCPGQKQEQAEEIIDLLKSQIEFLREELRARDEEIKRAHVLLQQSQNQVIAITDKNKPPEGLLKRILHRK